MNQTFFSGALAPPVIDRLAALPVHRSDVQAFVERMFRSMRAAGFAATDLSVLQAEILGALLSRLLPGNWEGRVPPITIGGRHAKLDRLVAHRADEAGLSRTFIDVACGFPPLTTVDTAACLTGWDVTGVDRSLPSYLVEDGLGNYAVFDDEGRALYFQPLVPDADSWEALLGDWEGSRDRLESLLQRLLAARTDGSERVELDGASLQLNPVRAYEGERLRFVAAELSDARIAPAGVVRCCNMLLYFDRAFRSAALRQLSDLVEPEGLLVTGTNWAHTTEARYFTFGKQGDALTDCEFAFSLDNVAPFGILPWYTLHDDDVEIEMLMQMVGLLRSDYAFREGFLTRSDELRARHQLGPRGRDGYYDQAPPGLPPGELWLAIARLGEQLAEEFAADAVNVLQRQGLRARVNEVGHVAVKSPVI